MEYNKFSAQSPEPAPNRELILYFPFHSSINGMPPALGVELDEGSPLKTGGDDTTNGSPLHYSIEIHYWIRSFPAWSNSLNSIVS